MTSYSIALLAMITAELDNPFHGFIKVSLRPVARLLDLLDETLLNGRSYDLDAGAASPNSLAMGVKLSKSRNKLGTKVEQAKSTIQSRSFKAMSGGSIMKWAAAGSKIIGARRLGSTVALDPDLASRVGVPSGTQAQHRSNQTRGGEVILPCPIPFPNSLRNDNMGKCGMRSS
jgi:hypothetical protein